MTPFVGPSRGDVLRPREWDGGTFTVSYVSGIGAMCEISADGESYGVSVRLLNRLFEVVEPTTVEEHAEDMAALELDAEKAAGCAYNEWRAL